MIDFLKRIDWFILAIIIMIVVLIVVVCAGIADAAENQYLKFQNFTGGLTTNQVGEIAPNTCLRLENFLFDNQELRVRKGYTAAAQGFHNQPVRWIGLYRKQGTAGKLFVQSGNKLFIVNRVDKGDTVWTDDEYSELFTTTGTVQKGDSNSYYMYGADSTSAFESYAFTSLDFDSTGMTTITLSVDYAVNDTTLRLTTVLPRKVTGWTYKFTAPVGTVISGETFVDSFYMATSTGILRYNDSTLLGSQNQEIIRFIPTSTITDNNYADVYYTFSSASLLNGSIGDAYTKATSGDAYLKVSLRHKGMAGSLLANKRYFFTYPVREAHWSVYNSSIIVRGFKGWFDYDTTGNQPIVSLVETAIDPTTKLTVYADSVIYRGTSTGDGTNGYTVIVDDSLMSGKDSTFFAAGDWFVSLGTSILDNFDSRNSPVIGNYFDDSLRIYVNGTWHDDFGGDTLDLNQPVTFYRRRIKSTSASGNNAAIFWNDRYHVVASSTPSQIDHSAQFSPSDFSDGLLTQVSPDDGEPILWLKEMYGALIIGKRSSIWRLTGVSGVDAFARLDKVVEGVSFVAPRSIVQRSGLMFGLGRDGFYVFDFNSMIRISEQINDLVKDSINWDYADQITGAYFDNHFWWSYPSRTSITNDRTLCYDPQNKALSTSTLNFQGIYVDAGVNDTDNVYIGDSDTGKVYLYGMATTDAGTPITAILATSWFDMGSSFLDKVVNRVSVSNHRTSSTSLSCSFAAKREDGLQVSSSRSLSGAQDTYRGRSRLWFTTDNLRGLEYQFSITATNAIGLRLGNVEVEYQILSAGY